MLSLLCCFTLPVTTLNGFQQEAERASLALDLSKLPVATEAQTLALETLNGFRLIHALEPVTMDVRLNASATAHAAAMAKKQVLTHKQDKLQTESALQRARKYGYDKNVSELVAMGMPDCAFAVVTFIDAPYHRRLLLKPGKFEFGCATEGTYSCFVLGGTTEQRIVCSPPSGSDGVPPEWDGREEPNPMRGTGCLPPFGYPVMLSVAGSTDLAVLTASMKTAAGTSVETVLKQPSNDPEAKDCAILIPKKPLAGRETYTVNFKFKSSGEERTETWSFRTGEAQAPVKTKKAKKSS